MATYIVVAAVIAVVAFLAGRAIAPRKLGVAEVERIGELTDLDSDTLKTAVVVTGVMGGTVTVTQEAAREKARNAKQKQSNDSEIADAQRELKRLNGDNQELLARNQRLAEIVGFMPPTPK